MRRYQKTDFPLIETRRHLETGPIVLVTSSWRGERNIMTMGWHMMMQFRPALFGCYIWEGNHSHELIRRSRECVINVPTWSRPSSPWATVRADAPTSSQPMA